MHTRPRTLATPIPTHAAARRTLAPSRARAFACLAPTRPAPMRLRLPIPGEILRRVELGLDLAAAGRDPLHWWERVEDRMEKFVHACLPPGASQVKLSLDERALEVEAQFYVEDEARKGRPS